MSEALHQLLISQRMSRPGTLHGITVDSRYVVSICKLCHRPGPESCWSRVNASCKVDHYCTTSDCINQLYTYIINSINNDAA